MSRPKVLSVRHEPDTLVTLQMTTHELQALVYLLSKEPARVIHTLMRRPASAFFLGPVGPEVPFTDCGHMRTVDVSRLYRDLKEVLLKAECS